MLNKYTGKFCLFLLFNGEYLIHLNAFIWTDVYKYPFYN
jgi:hypothetical protein